MVLNIILIAVAFVYGAFNVLTSKLMTAKEMKHSFIDGQCIVGKILTNIFYAPAWLLKGIRFLVLVLVK